MMKRYFITGLILLLPFAISLFLVVWIIDFLTDPFLSLTKEALTHFTQLENMSGFIIFLGRLLVLAFLFFFTLVLGFLARKYLFSRILTHIQTLFLKIPIVRTIYKLSHDLTKATFNTDTKLFTQTVLIPFPHADSLAIGLVTREVPRSMQKEPGVDVELAVFVPTSPHPISGFLLLTPQKLIKPIDLSTEDAFKYIISCGTMQQPKQPPT